MSKGKQTLQSTIQLILDILSFESSDDSLKHQFTHTTIEWDQLVILASEHLVLPAVYCRLQQKSLLGLLPKDLELYLEALTQLNRERNQSLLKEIKEISHLFNSHRIDHVFIKGTAMLAGNYYKDIGERMIGDIDILVAAHDLDNAYNLLVEVGYDKFLPFNYEVKNYRHLPRQISAQHLGAVELHDQLLKHNYNHLIDKNKFLASKISVGGIAVPSSDYLILNSILAQQINDRGHYYNTLKIKGLYDAFVLRLSHNKQLIKVLCNIKYGFSFLNLASLYCSNLAPTRRTTMSKFKIFTYNIFLKYPIFGHHAQRLKLIYLFVFERFSLFLFNKSYRRHLLTTKLNN